MRWYRETRIATPEVPLPRPEDAATATHQEAAADVLQAMDVTLS
jgi:hypothetical protein